MVAKLKTLNTYKTAEKIEPKAIEPFDREWGIGISGNTPEPSPFPRINRILKKTAKTTNGFVPHERALLVTEAHKNNPKDGSSWDEVKARIKSQL